MSWTIMDLNRDQLRDLLIKWNEALEVCREGVERWGCDPGRVELLGLCQIQAVREILIERQREIAAKLGGSLVAEG